MNSYILHSISLSMLLSCEPSSTCSFVCGRSAYLSGTSEGVSTNYQIKETAVSCPRPSARMVESSEQEPEEPRRASGVVHISPKPQIATQMTRKHQLQIEVLSEHKSNRDSRTLETPRPYCQC